MEAAKQHYVMTWELLEEGDDLGQWLLESFLAKGRTALPDGAYGMMSGAKHLYSKVPTEDEVRLLFEDAESFQKFLDGEDYSYGLANVPDAEYDEHYEAIVSAIKGVAKQGIVVDLPSVPHQFLREAPLVDGDWIDSYIVELTEWGARLVEKGLLLEESGDNHPIAWRRITDPADGSDADAALTMNLWQQTRKHLAGFPGRTRVIDGRHNLSFADYSKWRGRRNKGDLKSGMRRGLVVSSWNQWVESQGGEGVATLALAGDIERSERLLMETGEGQNQSPLTMDLAGLVETVQGSAREQVAYLVDMAKADALDLLGETRQAFELVERHV